MSGYSMLELFRQEVEAQAARLKQHLTLLQQSPPSILVQQQAIQAIKTIDALAQVVNVPVAATLSQAIQTRLEAIQPGIALEPVELDRLLEATDWLAEISQLSEADQHLWLTNHPQAIAALGAVEPSHSLDRRSDESDGPLAQFSDSQHSPPLPHPADLAADSHSVRSSTAFQGHPPLPPVDAQIMDLFRLEVEEQAKILNDGLITLELQPNAPQLLESLMRAAHSIKGAARIVGLDPAVRLAHSLEDCFVAAQNQTLTLDSMLIEQLLHGVDLLQHLSQVSDPDLPNWLQQQESEFATLQSTLQSAIQSNLLPTPELSAPANPHPSHPQPPPFNSPNRHSRKRDLGSRQNSAPHPTSPQTFPSSQSPPSLGDLGGQQNSGNEAKVSSQRVVRVSADNLNRIMGLAGELLVGANALPVFADGLKQVRTRQIALSAGLEALEQQLHLHSSDQLDLERFETVRSQEQQCRTLLSDRLIDLEELIRRTTDLSERLYREVIASQMRPFEEGVQNFPRMVRDLARSLNKQVRLEIIGKSTSVDRDILTRLEAPITHILRNAIDHGIEPPDQRQATGKPAEGRIRLEAAHRGGMLTIEIVDDGAGIDLERLRQAVVARQLVGPDLVSALKDTELMEFLFLPGFSLSTQLTELSGRGVGLDIVRTMVQEVGGTVRISSRPGKGTGFHFQLPLTLSVVRTLLVEVAGEAYALPLSRIDQIVSLHPSEIFTAENRQYFTLNQQHIGLIQLYQVLDLPPPTVNRDSCWVVVLRDASASYGLIIERCLGEKELVLRPLDSRLGKVQNISAAALMDDGSLVLILDVPDLIQSLNQLLQKTQPAKLRATQSPQHQDAKRILVVDDSITVREMERRLLQNHGYIVDVAVDGVEGWNAVRSYPYDLVISDIDMPRMNGIELIREIKQHSRLQSIPVVVVSYRDREDDCIQGLEAGANYYLTKNSFHDDTLIRAVTDLIGE